MRLHQTRIFQWAAAPSQVDDRAGILENLTLYVDVSDHILHGDQLV